MNIPADSRNPLEISLSRPELPGVERYPPSVATRFELAGVDAIPAEVPKRVCRPSLALGPKHRERKASARLAERKCSRSVHRSIKFYYAEQKVAASLRRLTLTAKGVNPQSRGLSIPTWRA